MDDKQTVNLDIKGMAGSGQSTIAVIIADALKQHGIEVTMDDAIPNTSKVPVGIRARTIADHGKVAITVTQVPFSEDTHGEQGPEGVQGNYGPNDLGYLNGHILAAAEHLKRAAEHYQGYSHARPPIPADHPIASAMTMLAVADKQTCRFNNRDHDPQVFQLEVSSTELPVAELEPVIGTEIAAFYAKMGFNMPTPKKVAGRIIEEAVELAMACGNTPGEIVGHLMDSLHNQSLKASVKAGHTVFPSQLIEPDSVPNCAEIADESADVGILLKLIAYLLGYNQSDGERGKWDMFIEKDVRATPEGLLYARKPHVKE